MRTDAPSSPAAAHQADVQGWPEGCGQCTYGLIDPPPVNGYTVPLYAARAMQWHFGYLAVCDCRAGQAYARLLNRIWNQIESKIDTIPLTWSTALHTQFRELDQPPTFNRVVHGMEID